MVVVVDVHAEATSRRWRWRVLDGSVSFVYGSHTHVKRDEQILDGGTAYITESGDGPSDGVIGMERPACCNGHAGLWRTVQRAEDRAASVCAVSRPLKLRRRALDVKRINCGAWQIVDFHSHTRESDGRSRRKNSCKMANAACRSSRSRSHTMPRTASLRPSSPGDSRHQSHW